MQPPTEPTPAAAPPQPVPRGDEAELYRRHHQNLQRAVTRAVNAPRELIEDACQNAWTTLLRVQPERTSIRSWLYVVATREALRLCERDRRYLHLETVQPAGCWDTVIGDALSLDDILEARDALKILASLPDRQRTDLTLLVAGYSYVEIAELTGGRTYTNVNKHIAKARARIRLARLNEAADAGGDRPCLDVVKGERPPTAEPAVAQEAALSRSALLSYRERAGGGIVVGAPRPPLQERGGGSTQTTPSTRKQNYRPRS